MMSLSTIRSMAQEAGRQHRRPYLVEQDDLDILKMSGVGASGIKIPFIGDYVAKGYVATENHYFVDISGLGGPGEHALTQEAFLAKLRVGYAYGLVEVGQFQGYVQEFKPTLSARKTGSLIKSIEQIPRHWEAK